MPGTVVFETTGGPEVLTACESPRRPSGPGEPRLRAAGPGLDHAEALLSPCSLPGRRRLGPRRGRIGGMASTSGIRAWPSWTLAPETASDRGRPVRSASRSIFDPNVPRPTGFGPAGSPFPRVRMVTESTARLDRAGSPRAPSSSGTTRWSPAGTPALLHPVKRRWAVGPDGPEHGGGRARVHPDAATNTTAAATSRSPQRRRPPPWGRAAPPAPPAGTAPTTRPVPGAPRSSREQPASPDEMPSKSPATTNARAAPSPSPPPARPTAPSPPRRPRPGGPRHHRRGPPLPGERYPDR